MFPLDIKLQSVFDTMTNKNKGKEEEEHHHHHHHHHGDEEGDKKIGDGNDMLM